MKVKEKKTLLLVEDEFLIALGKQQELEKSGYEVIHANTGEKAVTLSMENMELDLILMDIDLGKGIDGTEAAALILKECDIPVVFMSSHIEPEVVEKTERITSYGYVVKSSSITVLDASIKMAFKLFEANMKIEESDKKQKAMLADISDIIGIIGSDGIIKYMSSNIKKLFGWSLEEFVGSNIYQIVHPDDLERIQKSFATILENYKTTITLEFLNKCKDGTFKPVELTARNLTKDPLINGFLLNYRDISQRKLAEDTIKTYEQRLSLHINQTPLAVIDWDLDFLVASWNQSAERIFGFSSDEAIGKHASDIIVPESTKKQVNKVWMDLLNNDGGTRSTNENVTKNGEIILCDWYNTAIVDEKGSVIGISSLVSDHSIISK
ncbi:MAG: PAS domain S-box protein [Spirochaetia bacterium]|jgi:PAS domain S-box-containing protein|nr:PAS domain S-box protein [Spirochaetia bacterium]